MISIESDDLRDIILSATSPSVTVEDEDGYMLLSVFPLTDADRREFRIAPPSRAVYLKLKVATPGANSLAHEMLAQHFHALLIAGGRWNLQRLHGKKTAVACTYSVQEGEACCLALKADGKIEIVEMLSSNVELPPQQLTAVQRRDWACAKDEPAVGTALEEGVYFHPERREFPGADAFYILEPRHALLFQTSVKASPHGFTLDAVRWFAARGIHKFTYIYVTPPLQKPQVLLPRAHEDRFENRMYALELRL